MEEKWGKYNLRRKIAVGGMAEVFEAEMTGPSGFLKTVCLKRIKPDFSDDELFKQMFEGEARVAASLDHPNIVQVFDFDKHEGQFFLAMQLVEGLDLMKIIAQANRLGLRLPLGFSIYVMRELLRALAYAHGRLLDGEPVPVVHRDVSPHNILVSIEGEVKLADFGIAKARGAADPTKVGVVKGKFAYLSPEQARGQKVCPESDLFSAGLVLWEMITGERFLQADSEIGLVGQVLNASAKEIRGVSEKLNEFLKRLLRKEPQERFPSAASALEELKDLGIQAYEKEDVGALVKKMLRAQTAWRALKSEQDRAGARLEDGKGGAIAPKEAPGQLRRSGTKLKSVSEIDVGSDGDFGDKGAKSDVGGWPKSESAIRRVTFKRKGVRALLWLVPLAAVIIAISVWAFNRASQYEGEGPSFYTVEPIQGESPGPAEEAHVNNEGNDELVPPVAELPERLSGFVAVDPDAGTTREAAAVETDSGQKKKRGDARTGALEVNVRPWARVVVDGIKRGTTPLKNITLQPGMHKVLLINEELGYNQQLNVRVRPSKTTAINKTITGHTSDEASQ